MCTINPSKSKELETIGFFTISQILLRCRAQWSRIYLHSLYPCLTNPNLLSLAKSNLVLKKMIAGFSPGQSSSYFDSAVLG